MIPAESLAATALLRGLEPEVAEKLRAAARLREFEAGQLVLSREDASDDVFFVLRGGVRVVVLASAGREIIFTDHGPGEQFGELAAIDQAPRSATVTTLYPTQLLALPGAQFRAALVASPIIAGRVIGLLTTRLRSLSQRFVEVALGSVRHRLVAELVRQSRPRSGAAGEERIVSPPPRHHILAARIGVRREAVTRELAALEKLGLVRQEPKGIVITRGVALTDLDATS